MTTDLTTNIDCERAIAAGAEATAARRLAIEVTDVRLYLKNSVWIDAFGMLRQEFSGRYRGYYPTCGMGLMVEADPAPLEWTPLIGFRTSRGVFDITDVLLRKDILHDGERIFWSPYRPRELRPGACGAFQPCQTLTIRTITVRRTARVVTTTSGWFKAEPVNTMIAPCHMTVSSLRTFHGHVGRWSTAPWA